MVMADSAAAVVIGNPLLTTAVEVVSWRNSTPGSLVDIQIPESPLGSNALADCDPYFRPSRFFPAARSTSGAPQLRSNSSGA